MEALTHIVAGVITNSGKFARRFDLHVLHREDTTKTTMKVKVKDNRHQADVKEVCDGNKPHCMSPETLATRTIQY